MRIRSGRAMGVAAWLVLAIVWSGAASRAEAPPLSDPAAGMDAKQAYERGLALGAKGRHNESLHYLRHALSLRPDLWQVQFDYATGLANATVEVAPHRHVPGPVARSSWERVAMMHEALEHLEGAEAVAIDPRQRGLAIHRLGTLVGTWGLEWDALRGFQLAMIADPATPSLKQDFAAQVARMRDAGDVASR